MVDWNDDGLKDLLVGDYWGKVEYFRNAGTPGNPALTSEGYLVVDGSELSVINNACPCVEDWNGDGLNDLLVGASDGFVRLFINEGSNADPVFIRTEYVTLETGEQLSVPGRAAPVVIDLNNDGLKDVVSGCTNGKAYFFENAGTNSNPQLLDPVTLGIDTLDIYAGATGRFAPIDWDGDGTVDLMAGSIESRLKLYRQTSYTQPVPQIILTNNSGWIIPTSGGVVEFTIEIENPAASTLTFDVWTEARLPDYSYFGPLLSRSDVTLVPAAMISRDLSQSVPASAPNGLYFYHGYVGNFAELQVYDDAYFFFHKMDIGGGDCVEGWELYGWFDELAGENTTVPPEKPCLVVAPNPFNEVTTINYDLPASGYITILVYNSHGRKLTTLVEGYAPKGKHALNWNAGDFSSGIYLVSLQTESQQDARKVVLLK
jgi:hypothetical protein